MLYIFIVHRIHTKRFVVPFFRWVIVCNISIILIGGYSFLFFVFIF